MVSTFESAGKPVTLRVAVLAPISVAEVTRRVGRRRLTGPAQLAWLDIGVDEFTDDPARQLPRLYRRYRQGEELPS
jgi:hypothetical protein